MPAIPQLLVITCLALLFDCEPACTQQEAPEAVVRKSGRQVLLVEAGSETAFNDDGYRSFALNHAGDCLVLSTLDDDLLPHSWVVGPSGDTSAALHLEGQLPIHISDGYSAFSSLPDSEVDESVRLSVVNSMGELILDSGSSALLSAGISRISSDYFCMLHWDGIDELSGMYQGTRVSMHSTVDGSLQADWPLRLELPVSDLELLYIDDSSALVLVLYDIYYWQVLRLDRATGEHSMVYTLEGQPMYDKLLPSRSDRLSHLVLADGRVEMDVITFEDGNLRLSIDPRNGDLQQISEPGTYPQHLNESYSPADNSVSHSHLSQQVLPLKLSADWELPAWRDQSGRLLLLNDDGPLWLELP